MSTGESLNLTLVWIFILETSTLAQYYSVSLPGFGYWPQEYSSLFKPMSLRVSLLLHFRVFYTTLSLYLHYVDVRFLTVVVVFDPRPFLPRIGIRKSLTPTLLWNQNFKIGGLDSLLCKDNKIWWVKFGHSFLME